MAYRTGNFVSVNWSQELNLDQVRRFEYLRDGKVRVWWANGDDEVFEVGGQHGIDTAAYHIVPALPGFELVTYFPEEDLLQAEPVIAWRIEEHQTYERFSDANPIAIGLTATSHDSNSAVRWPEGKLTIKECGQIFENVEEWKEWLRAEEKANVAKKLEAVK
jgi:hypothetical protein